MSSGLDRQTQGVFAISPTPFHSDGQVDFASLDSLLDFYAQSGANGVTVLGQLGEAAKLDLDENLRVAEFTAKRSSLPVVVGVTAAGFASMKRVAAQAMEAGAAGVMIAPSPALRTDDSIINYFDCVVEAIGTDVPFVLQDYPLVFNVTMTARVISEIATRHESCVMLKHEDWPGLEKITAIRFLEAAGEMPRLSILTGNGALFYDLELDRGVDGAMTGYCFPEMLVRAHRLSTAGARLELHDVFDAHLPLIRYEQQLGTGLGVRKYVLAKRGVIASDTQRLPRTTLSGHAAEEIDFLLERLLRNDPEIIFEIRGKTSLSV